jgi:hypothetical protein
MTPKRSTLTGWYRQIRTAINARRIMINEITGLESDEEEIYLPRLICWPLKPQMQNLELVNFCLGMLWQIAIAFIFCDCRVLFSKFCESPDFKVDKCLNRGAEQSHNPVYLKLIEDVWLRKARHFRRVLCIQWRL